MVKTDGELKAIIVWLSYDADLIERCMMAVAN